MPEMYSRNEEHTAERRGESEEVEAKHKGDTEQKGRKRITKPKGLQTLPTQF